MMPNAVTIPAGGTRCADCGGILPRYFGMTVTRGTARVPIHISLSDCQRYTLSHKEEKQ